jgi:hypothetical protein
MMPETPLPELIAVHKMHAVLHGGNGGGGLVGKYKDLEMRTRKLEAGQAKLLAIAGVVSGLVSGVLVAVAVKLLGG